MKIKFLSASLAALALAGCAVVPAAPPQSSAPSAERAAAVGPALWKVSDEDTTIYLFGTVHALPAIVEWYDGEIKTALGSAQELVTEIPEGAAEDPDSQQMIAMRAVLPPGQSMRDLLNPEQRATYEAAMTKLGMPVAAFDRFEPWFAGMTLAVLPLLQRGYKADTGVENVIDKEAAPTTQRSALETIDEQIAMFDTLPQASQVAFLVSTAQQIDSVVPNMDAMVAKWLEGDAAGLAVLMNEGLTDKVLAETLLYSRNRKWAGWIDQRLDTPGTVFLAVGAGHLAGKDSVQDALKKRGITVVRVQ